MDWRADSHVRAKLCRICDKVSYLDGSPHVHGPQIRFQKTAVRKRQRTAAVQDAGAWNPAARQRTRSACTFERAAIGAAHRVAFRGICDQRLSWLSSERMNFRRFRTWLRKD